MLRDYCSVDPLKSGILTSLSSQNGLSFSYREDWNLCCHFRNVDDDDFFVICNVMVLSITAWLGGGSREDPTCSMCLHTCTHSLPNADSICHDRVKIIPQHCMLCSLTNIEPCLVINQMPRCHVSSCAIKLCKNPWKMYFSRSSSSLWEPLMCVCHAQFRNSCDALRQWLEDHHFSIHGASWLFNKVPG